MRRWLAIRWVCDILWWLPGLLAVEAVLMLGEPGVVWIRRTVRWERVFRESLNWLFFVPGWEELFGQDSISNASK